MKISTRIYLDAGLQNIKSVAFFTFLPVLIARLGASDFQIALSNSLPPLFCALSLAFLTRQLPVTRGVYLTSGYVRQFAFLSMALSVMLPHPIPYLLFFWSINAVSVMITGAQQPAIMRRVVPHEDFPRMFSTNKLIGIVILVAGSYGIGHALDATQRFFPMNYSVSMLVGCLATFTGMNLIAALAPHEKKPVRLHLVRPFRECNRRMWWMALNNIGIAMAAPLFTIYHVNRLGLTNTQIAYFVIASGIVSALLMPFTRRAIERFGAIRVYGLALLGMALAILPYGRISSFSLLVLLQAWLGGSAAVAEVATNSVMMEEAEKHKKEMDFFSDFQLLMNGGNAIGALLSGALLSMLPIWGCFLAIAAIRIGVLCAYRLTLTGDHEKTALSQEARVAAHRI
ncbi:MFS transporter [Gorillibacterium sp. sgz5001074]|uniref:MFS transporter n=1 Tax=Gorillibacterium sp. sgz5001074 TaxID=3446695 RepID=UPI003F681662